MKLLQLLLLLILFSYSSSSAAAAPVYAIPGCQERCGNVLIPYPFGLGPRDCYLNNWFAVSCNASGPYLTALDQEILAVNLENQTVTINSSMTNSNCAAGNPVWSSIDLSGTPFLFSSEHNKFLVTGCGNALVLDQQRNAISGCSSICNTSRVSNSTSMLASGCLGVGCCQATLPYYLQKYNVDVSGLENTSNRGRGCGGSEAFLMGENLFRGYRIGNGTRDSLVQVALLWTLMTRYRQNLTNQEFNEMVLLRDSCRPRVLDLGNGTWLETRQCYCGQLEEGNPYLRGTISSTISSTLSSTGCQVAEQCAGCTGRCLLLEGNITCFNPIIDPTRLNSIGLILGVSISVGTLILVGGGFWLYKVVRRVKNRRRKARFFKLNGGLLLQQEVSSNEGLVEKTKVFTSKELEKATDYFNENRVLGRGGQGTVYKGMLTDGRIVAVKKSKLIDESQLEQFINEVVILSQINHRNVVKLLGCCLETEVPLLVYEYISSGTLYEHIHDDEFPLSWNMRLQIASEVAGALAYLHSAASIPIYHRDIKSTNILLDEKHKAKVADFGTSRSVSVEQTHLTTLVKGTFGYLDPEYFQSSQFTEKSDVYSFGVVLVELLTGEKPISSTRSGEHRSLATHFILAMEEDTLYSILDDRVANIGSTDDVMAVANLAYKCLNLNGKNRPTMKEVAAELESIKTRQVSSTVRPNIQKMADNRDEEVLNLLYDDSISTGIHSNSSFM